MQGGKGPVHKKFGNGTSFSRSIPLPAPKNHNLSPSFIHSTSGEPSPRRMECCFGKRTWKHVPAAWRSTSLNTGGRCAPPPPASGCQSLRYIRTSGSVCPCWTAHSTGRFRRFWRKTKPSATSGAVWPPGGSTKGCEKSRPAACRSALFRAARQCSTFCVQGTVMCPHSSFFPFCRRSTSALSQILTWYSSRMGRATMTWEKMSGGVISAATTKLTTMAGLRKRTSICA